jgi:adenine-specific DNA-methyltransferase
MAKPGPQLAAATHPATALPFDRSLALQLAATLAHQNRAEFARSFSAALVEAYWKRLYRTPPPTSFNLIASSGGAVLPADAWTVTEQIAAAIESLSPAAAAYAVGSLYTALLPDSFRAQHGIFYTPPEIVECLLFMAEDAGIDWQTARVLDPACGGGAFMIAIADRMRQALKSAEPAITLQSIATRLRGFDFDPFGSWLAQAMLAIMLEPLAQSAGRELPNFVEVRDSLDLRSSEAEHFDLVIGNPPYGRTTLSPLRRKRFSRSVYGHANLYGVFTDAALHWVKEAGVIGYVTPPSMLSGLYYKSLRALLISEAPPLAVNFISERNGVFADVLQETMLATYRKGGSPVPGRVGFIKTATEKDVVSRNAGYFTFPAAADAPWLLPRLPEQSTLVKRLRSMPHRLVDYGYRVSTGPLVWNRFKDQLRPDFGPAAFPVIWAESVTSGGRFSWRSEKRNHSPWFIARRPKDDWLIVTQPCVLLQRTTAKEQARRLIAAELPASFIRNNRGVVVENHLNMVRTIEANAALSAGVIVRLLNSAAVDSAFRCINGSVAVSAFELEQLPLPPPSVMANLGRLIAAGATAAKIEAVIAAAYGSRDASATA